MRHWLTGVILLLAAGAAAQTLPEHQPDLGNSEIEEYLDQQIRRNGQFSTTCTAGQAVVAPQVVQGKIIAGICGAPTAGSSTVTVAFPITGNGSFVTPVSLTGAIPAVNVNLSTVPATGSCSLPNVVTALNAGVAPTCTQPSNVTGSAALNVLKTGDTMTGGLVVQGGAGINANYGVVAGSGTFSASLKTPAVIFNIGASTNVILSQGSGSQMSFTVTGNKITNESRTAIDLRPPVANQTQAVGRVTEITAYAEGDGSAGYDRMNAPSWQGYINNQWSLDFEEVGGGIQSHSQGIAIGDHTNGINRAGLRQLGFDDGSSGDFGSVVMGDFAQWVGETVTDTRPVHMLVVRPPERTDAAFFSNSHFFDIVGVSSTSADSFGGHRAVWSHYVNVTDNGGDSNLYLTHYNQHRPFDTPSNPLPALSTAAVFTDTGNMGLGLVGNATPKTTLEVNGNFQVGSGVNKSTFSTTGALSLAAPLTVANGGTGVATLAAHTLTIGEGTSAVVSLPALGNGGLVIGAGTGVDPTTATLTGTANQIVVTNAAGAITLSTPQNINSGATPTFTATNFSGVSAITGLGSQSQALDMGTHLINNVTDPAAAQDAATKNYVDSSAPSLDYKAPARLATAAALPSNSYSNGSSGVGATITGLSLGLLTVDGVSPAVGDRVLVKNESTSANNGIYKVSTNLAGAFFVLTRATDHDQAVEMSSGVLVAITDGSTNADETWLETTKVYTVGTDAVTFIQTSGLGDVTAGTNLSKSGNTISLADPLISPITISSTETVNGVDSSGISARFKYGVSVGSLTLSGAAGNIVSQASSTASAFFGDGSHLSSVHTYVVHNSFNGDISNTALNVCVDTITLTLTVAGPIDVKFSGAATSDNNSATIKSTFLLDGKFDTGLSVTLPLASGFIPTNGNPYNLSFDWITASQTAGAHNVCLVLADSAAVIRACAGSKSFACQFSAKSQ